jgi:hypothetical protein
MQLRRYFDRRYIKLPDSICYCEGTVCFRILEISNSVFKDSFKQRMTKIDFSNQFFYLFKRFKLDGSKLLRNCSRFAAVSFSEGITIRLPPFSTKDRKSFAMLAEYHRVHLKDDILFSMLL